MANGILGQLLGQSGGGQSLLGGGVFSTPVNRGERRLNLLGEAMQNFGGSPQTNLGASLGLLAGRGIAGLAGGEDPVLQRADKIRRVQSAVQQEGLDPVNTPNEFFTRTSELFEQEGLPDLAQQTRLQQIQLTPEPQEPREREFFTTGDTAVGRAAGLRPGERAKVRIQGRDVVRVDEPLDTSQEGRGVNVMMPGGEIIAAIETPSGDLVSRQTGESLPRDVRKVSLGLTAQKEEDLPQSTVQSLQEDQIAVTNFTQTAQDAIDLVTESGSANTLAAAGAGFLQDLQTEAQGLASALGVEWDTQQLDPDTYSSTLDELGITNSRLRGVITSLAFQAATAAGETSGRLSNQDVERFIREIGGNRSDPVAFSQTLRDSVQRAQRNFRNAFRIKTGEEFKGDLPELSIGEVARPGEEPQQGGGSPRRGTDVGGVDFRYDPELDRLVPVE